MLWKSYDLVGSGSAKNFRNIVGVLAVHYPYMFSEDPMRELADGQRVRLFGGKGLGGVTGLISLPKTLQQKYHRRLGEPLGSSQKRRSTATGSGRTVPRKRRVIYGVDSRKFFATGNVEALLAALRAQGVESDSARREAVFAAHRCALQQILLSDEREKVRSFWKDLLHCQEQFAWLTQRRVADTIREQAAKHFGILGRILKVHLPLPYLKVWYICLSRVSKYCTYASADP
jgi:hypothetical protein